MMQKSTRVRLTFDERRTGNCIVGLYLGGLWLGRQALELLVSGWLVLERFNLS